jgi:hypothetical protein
MMELYSEFYNGDRKATVTLISQHWDKSFNKWEVAMYVNGRVIERRTLSSESLAENIAEDFVNSGNYGDSILLNEGK